MNDINSYRTDSKFTDISIQWNCEHWLSNVIDFNGLIHWFGKSNVTLAHERNKFASRNDVLNWLWLVFRDPFWQKKTDYRASSIPETTSEPHDVLDLTENGFLYSRRLYPSRVPIKELLARSTSREHIHGYEVKRTCAQNILFVYYIHPAENHGICLLHENVIASIVPHQRWNSPPYSGMAV